MTDADTGFGAVRAQKPRRFGRWLAPSVIIAVALLMLLMFRVRSRRGETAPSPLPPDPALLATFPRLPTGWAVRRPMPLYMSKRGIHRGTAFFDTGVFVHTQTDFYVNDVIPINFTRVQLQRDKYSRCFGVGGSNYYDMFLSGDNAPFTYIELINADASRIYFHRVSPGIGFSNAVYRHDRGPHDYDDFFTGAIIHWNGFAWDMWLKDGTLMRFPPSKYAKTAGQAALLFIQDKEGHRLTIDRDAAGNILRITSPNGGVLTLTHDNLNRITRGVDSYGHWVSYLYDSQGRLTAARDSAQGVTRYVYGAHTDLIAIFKPDGKKWFWGAYDASDRIVSMNFSFGQWWRYSYTTDAQGNVTAVDVLDADGEFSRITLDAAGNEISKRNAYVGAHIPPATNKSIKKKNMF